MHLGTGHRPQDRSGLLRRPTVAERSVRGHPAGYGTHRAASLPQLEVLPQRRCVRVDNGRAAQDVVDRADPSAAMPASAPTAAIVVRGYPRSRNSRIAASRVRRRVSLACAARAGEL